MEQPTLTTSRLTLRPFEFSDASAVQRLAGAREIAETTLNIPHPYLDGMAERWIGDHPKQREYGTGLHYAVIRRDEGDLIGAVGTTANMRHGRAEIGYWIGVPYWNKGYCTEACAVVLEYLFDHAGFNRITASHLPRNPASGRVMEKLGMIREGFLREHYAKNETFEDVVVYGLLAEEWRKFRRGQGRGS